MLNAKLDLRVCQQYALHFLEVSTVRIFIFIITYNLYVNCKFCSVLHNCILILQKSAQRYTVNVSIVYGRMFDLIFAITIKLIRLPYEVNLSLHSNKLGSICKVLERIKKSQRPLLKRTLKQLTISVW